MSGCNRTIETGSRSGSIVPGNIPAINFSAHPPLSYVVMDPNMNTSKLHSGSLVRCKYSEFRLKIANTLEGHLEKLSMHGDVASCAMTTCTVTN